MANILLAEDDDSMRVFLAKALERAGHSVASYGQGDEALGELDQQSFDLLLTDIVMPVMDGIELARRAVAVDPARVRYGECLVQSHQEPHADALGGGGTARQLALFPGPRQLRDLAVRAAQRGRSPVGRRRLEPAAPAPGDDDSPADALHRAGRLRCALRVRVRGARDR